MHNILIVALLTALLLAGCTPVSVSQPSSSSTPEDTPIPSSTPPPSATPSPSPTLRPTRTPIPVQPADTPPPGLSLFAPGSDPLFGVDIYQLNDFNSQALGEERLVRIYLPPGYAQSDQAYPVLYANDGQEMAGVKLKAALEAGYASGEIQSVIVVALFAGPNRLSDYGIIGDHAAIQSIGVNAEAYATFLIDEIMPWVNTNYRTLTGPENTVLYGFSLGGLSAFDLAWNYPHLFGKVGVMSGSFWVRTPAETPAERQAARIMHQVVRAGPFRPGMQFWFQAGTRDETDDRDGNGVIDAIQDTTELIDELTALGYIPGVDTLYIEVEDGQHNPATWATVMPDFLRWAFPAIPEQ